MSSEELDALLAYCGSAEAQERVTDAWWLRSGPRASLDSLSPEEWARGLAPLLLAALDEPAISNVWHEVAHAEPHPRQSDYLRCLAEPEDSRNTWATLFTEAATVLGPRIRDVALAAVRREVFGVA